MTTWERALVTGASSGIGEAIARRLAAEGTELVLVARSKPRLQELADEFGPSTEVLVADLTNQGDLERVSARLAESPGIDFLVNNAGVGRSGNFADADVDAAMAQLELNIVALVRLTHAALPVLRPVGGSILNVSSVAGYTPIPDTGVYGATKAFVSSFSQAIHGEEKPNGVTVSAIAPGFTRTGFQKEAEFDSSSIPDFLWQSADEVAAEALDGVRRGKPMIIPGAHNKVMVGSVKGLPGSVQRKITSMF